MSMRMSIGNQGDQRIARPLGEQILGFFVAVVGEFWYLKGLR